MKYTLVLLALLVGCASDLTPPVTNCEPFATRCDGQLAQVCSPSQRWRTAQDCAATRPVEMHWICCANPQNRYVCLPAGECNASR